MNTVRVRLDTTTLLLEHICGWRSWQRRDYNRAGEAMTSIYLVNGGACELEGEWAPALERAFEAAS